MRLAPAALAVSAALWAACGSSAPSPTPPTAGATGPRAEAVAAQVKPYLDGEIVTGGVIALIDGDRIETYGFGRARDGGPAPDADTVFELGAVTKVFTALLTTTAIARGEMAMDTPISQLLPFGLKLPSKDGTSILVGHLLTHTSQLPTVPPAVAPRITEDDPYRSYTVEQVYDDLGTVELEQQPGAGFQYSNFAYAVLGHAVAHKAGKPWADLVTERVLTPLGMTATRVGPPADPSRSAQGHDPDLKPLAPWSLGAMAPAGAITSTASDMAAFVRANLAVADGAKDTDRNGQLLARGQQVIVEGSGATRALAWFVDEHGRRWHNGGTAGQHAFVAFDPKRRHGVVVLAATSSSLVDRLGEAMLSLLAGDPPDPVHFPDAAALGNLAGIYDLQGTAVNVTLQGKRLYVQSGEDPPTRMVPLSPTEFLIEEAEAVMVFTVEGGRAVRLTLVLGGQELVAERKP
jgi:D-alanyl-D-alanine-carboxypeptidase/D-alanyl-D-alanine-endopeptidase